MLDCSRLFRQCVFGECKDNNVKLVISTLRIGVRTCSLIVNYAIECVRDKIVRIP